MAAMQTERALPWFWLWLWFWLWFGLSFCGDDREQTIPGLGQACEGATAGRCDTNLSCVPDYDRGLGEEASSGVCIRVPPPAGCIPCSEVECSLENWDCRRGHVTDPCGCCPHCARQRGQVCGGPHWGRGYCDRRLTCALFLGNAPATPPETGVCKALPGFHADKHCPWKWGCNVRMGTCDCYGEQTCHDAFSYNLATECWKVMQEDWSHAGTEEEKEEQEEKKKVERPCMKHVWEVQDDRCVYLERNCSFFQPTLFSRRRDCENLLKRIRCANVICPVVPVPSCPSDSFLTEPYTPLRQCCPQVPALCTCDFKRCPVKPPNCPPGHHAHIVTRGNGQPGNCCHRYLCRLGKEESATQNREEPSMHPMLLDSQKDSTAVPLTTV